MNNAENFFYTDEFALRLSLLREAREISACAMSHDLGHNRNYINGIELQKYLPSLAEFLEICNYLHAAPNDFFRLSSDANGHIPPSCHPAQLTPLSLLCGRLTPQQAESLCHLLREFL